MSQASFEPRAPLEAGAVRSIVAAWAVVFILLSAGGALVGFRQRLASPTPPQHAAASAQSDAEEDDAAW
jgi:hypothetical protein